MTDAVTDSYQKDLTYGFNGDGVELPLAATL
jgi:hypothetical protein